MAKHDSTLGWSELTVEGVEVHIVPGNHLTMLRKPNVQALAEQLKYASARNDRSRTKAGNCHHSLQGENQCRHCQRVAGLNLVEFRWGVRKRGLSINYDVKVFVPLPY